jgi:ATP-binding cassette, subfamily B, bacterial MsbA
MTKKAKRPLRAEDWDVFKRTLKYAWPYKSRLILGVFFGLIFAGSMVGLLPTAREYLGQIFDIEQASLSQTLMVGGIMILLGFGRGVGQFISFYYIEWVGNRVVTDLRIESFTKLQTLSMRYFGASKSGDIISRVSTDSIMVQHAVSTVMKDLVSEPFVLIGVLGYLFYLDWKLAIAMFILMPLSLIPVTFFGRRVRRFTRESQNKLGDMVSRLHENIAGMRIVKAFGMEAFERKRFAGEAEHVFGKQMKVAVARSANDPVMVEVSIIAVCCALLYAKFMGMTMNNFMVFAVAFVMLYQPIKKLSRVNLQIQQSSGAAERLFEIIDTETDVLESANPIELQGPISSVRFENVGFAYGDEQILNNVSLDVKSGQCIAFVGSSGAGKTTLVNLLPRFYDAVSGRITINGIDIRELSLASLRANIGLVTQETILFNDTVANNIGFGRMDATRDEIVTAARRANAHEFISGLPQGYDTMIGERGSTLSGGQCQRLAIARALLRDPPLLILDEATSALDTESERQVQSALDELMANRTVFAIAHRLSTIQHADRIVVLDKGRLVEQGTHAELIDHAGIYKYLHDLQFNV